MRPHSFYGSIRSPGYIAPAGFAVLRFAVVDQLPDAREDVAEELVRAPVAGLAALLGAGEAGEHALAFRDQLAPAILTVSA